MMTLIRNVCTVGLSLNRGMRLLALLAIGGVLSMIAGPLGAQTADRALPGTLSVLLDCGFDARGEFVVNRVDTLASEFVAGIDEGRSCLEAYAELRGRFEAVRRPGGAETQVVGPVIASLSPDDPVGNADAIIWDIGGPDVYGGGGSGCRLCDCVPVGACGVCCPAPPTIPLVEFALLVCGKAPDGLLRVRYADANRPALVRGIEPEMRCAEARAQLQTQFEELGLHFGHVPDLRGPIAGISLSIEGEQTLTFTYETVAQ